jgi:hypothetical protein
MPSPLLSRAGELDLSSDEFEALLPQLSEGVAAALLAALIRYEDALADLATPHAVDAGGAQP